MIATCTARGLEVAPGVARAAGAGQALRLELYSDILHCMALSEVGPLLSLRLSRLTLSRLSLFLFLIPLPPSSIFLLPLFNLSAL